MADTQSLIQRGITLARQGRKAEAKACFAYVVSNYPGNLMAWLWLARLAEDVTQREYCYEKVLQIAPDNLEAEEALKSMRRSYEPVTAAPLETKPLQDYDRPKTSSGLGRYKYLTHVAMDMVNGALAPIIHLISSFFKFLTYTDD